jgi:hypothetical protein
VAGLVRTDAGGGFEDEFAGLAEALRSAHDGHGVTDPGPPGTGNPSPTEPEGE